MLKTFGGVKIFGSQIILSQNYQFKIAITHKNINIYVENPFFLKGKTTGQTPNNFTITKSIIIILVYVSRLKKNLSYFSLLTHTHTNYLSQRQQHFALPFLYSSPCTTLS